MDKRDEPGNVVFGRWCWMNVDLSTLVSLPRAIYKLQFLLMRTLLFENSSFTPRRGVVDAMVL